MRFKKKSIEKVDTNNNRCQLILIRHAFDFVHETKITS